MRRWTAVMMGFAFTVPTLHAQDAFVLAYFPPSFDNGADRNNAVVHYRIGEDALRHRPYNADESFLWASRLNPVWALPLYGRAVAQEGIRYQTAMLAAMLREPPEEPGRAQLHFLDSLLFAAYTRDPFLDRRIDRLLAEGQERKTHLRVRMGNRKVNLPDEVGLGETEFLERDYVGATENWGKALKEMPDLLPLHTWRAEAFYALKKYDSAAMELDLLANKITTREEKELVFEFQSKSIAIYSLGVLQVQLNQLSTARTTFQRALTEDLGLYMAHVRLAGLSLLTADTASAVTELGAAVDLNETDASIIFQYGYVLIAAGRYNDAIVELRKGIAANPWFALPYLYLGRVLDAQGKTTEAIAAYQGYIDHARAPTIDLPGTVERVVQLSRAAATKK